VEACVWRCVCGGVCVCLCVITMCMCVDSLATRITLTQPRSANTDTHTRIYLVLGEERQKVVALRDGAGQDGVEMVGGVGDAVDEAALLVNLCRRRR
jgi:hypothetical protein